MRRASWRPLWIPLVLAACADVPTQPPPAEPLDIAQASMAILGDDVQPSVRQPFDLQALEELLGDPLYGDAVATVTDDRARHRLEGVLHAPDQDRLGTLKLREPEAVLASDADTEIALAVLRLHLEATHAPGLDSSEGDEKR